MRTIATLCLGLALSGCLALATEENLREQIVKNAATWCREIGLDPSSEKWADCMITMVDAGRREDETRRAAFINRRDADTQPPRSSGGISFMCKNAIQRGDRGAIFTFC